MRWAGRGILGCLVVVLVAGSALAQAPGTRVRFKNPDPDKWAGGGQAQLFSATRNGVYQCRPLACPVPSKVLINFYRSPTRKPDPAALKNLALKIPAAIERANANAAYSMSPGRQMERLSSGTGSVRGYPALIQDVRVTGGKDPCYAYMASIFVKSIIVNIVSTSMKRDVARRNFDVFAAKMEVEDRPPQR